MEEFEITCCIRGYHKEIWEAAVGEELGCVREPHNSHDRYAVAVKREDVLYLPLYYIVLTNFVWISLYFNDTYLLYWPRFILLSLVTFATSLLARAIACEGRRREMGCWGREDHLGVSNSLKSTSLLSSLSISPPAANSTRVIFGP